jgi:hypothetical protein
MDYNCHSGCLALARAVEVHFEEIHLFDPLIVFGLYVPRITSPKTGKL